MTNVTQQGTGRRPTQPATVFLLSAVWIFIALLLSRIAGAAVPALWAGVIRHVGAAIFLAVGFHLLAVSFVHDLRPLSTIGFVRRPGILREFGSGAALGWGIALALVLPSVLTGHYTVSFDLSVTALLRMCLSLVELLAVACSLQLVLSGLPMRMLERTVGAGWASTVAVLVAFVLGLTGVTGEGINILMLVLAARLFTVAFLRTRALWLPLGVQVGWTASLVLLFGAPSPWVPAASSVVSGYAQGPVWLTGAPYGPEAASFAIVVLIIANVVLYRVTRDYAWHYAYQPAEGAGQAVEIAPPAEHIKEEARVAAAPVPLVQIQGVPPLAPALPDSKPLS